MENEVHSANPRFAEGLKRMEEARAAFQSIPEERFISPMPVVVHYLARIGEVRLTKRDQEYIFTISGTLSDGKGGEHWEEVTQNAFAIRDEFLKIKNPSVPLRPGLAEPMAGSQARALFISF